MRVLVLWADDHSHNLGVRALAEGTAEIARRAWGGDVVVRLQDFGPGASGRPLGGRAVAGDVGRAHGPVKELLRGADVVIDTGAGDSFTDIYGPKRLAVMLYTQRLAMRLGKPLVLGPQTIGPFASRLARAGARRTLARASAVLVRDPSSASSATALGRAPDAEATDVVFALRPAGPGVPRDVVLNVSGLLWHDGPHVDASRYRALMHELCDRLLAEGRTVSLLAHVLDAPTDDNDVRAIRAFAGERRTELEIIEPTSLDDVRGVLASAELVIGSRMHACLNALSVGTPAIALAYSRKFAPLMSDLGWTHTIDLRTATDAADLVLRTAADPDLRQQLAQVRARAEAKLERAVAALREVAL